MNDATRNRDRALILVRTHFVDARVADMARRLAASDGYDVMIAADETVGPIDSLGLPKLSMTLDSSARLGLNVAFDQPMWRCGDYLFYHALALERGYKHYWSIEYDVTLNFEDPLDFFRFFDREAKEDYLTTFLEVAEPSWEWRPAALRRFGLVYKSGFPLVRLNANAVAKLHQRRRFENAQLAKDRLDPAHYWLNDEAFVSSAAPELALSVADLNAYGAFYSPETLKRGGVWAPAQLPPPDGKIYHAVRTGLAFLRATTSYYDFELPDFFTWADAGLPQFGDAATHLLTARLAKTPDDPAALFGPGGALADVVAHFQDQRIVAALMRALARRRLRVCIEAIQGDRLETKLARAPAFDNLALGRPAWQSSVSLRSRVSDLRGDAEGGNDGDVDVEYGFHTAFQDAPWWAVDLGAERRIRLVRLFNRRQAENKLRLFEIEISSDFLAWTQVYAHAAADRELLHKRPIEIAVTPPALARYVRVRLARQGVLHLAEVEVIGA